MNQGIRVVILRRVCLLLVLMGGSATAQVATLAPGASVRVWSPELPRRPWNATLRGATEDSLALRVAGRRDRGGDTLRSVSRASITRMEILTRRTRGQGARFHALLGAVVGFANGFALEGLAAGMGAEFAPFEFSVPVATAAGVAVGAVSGAIFPGKYWRRASATLPAPPDRSVRGEQRGKEAQGLPDFRLHPRRQTKP